MARPLRIEFAGAFYHVTSRGNERREIFSDRADCQKFLAFLAELPIRYGVIIHGFVLMGNHYHLLLETSRPNLSRAMQYLNTSYSVYSNKRHERVGHFLQGRYKAFLIEKDPYLLAVSRYLHLNPVRANLAAKPEDYAWSSYQDYIGKNTRFEYLTSRMVLNQFSPDLLHAKRRYREFVEEGMQKAENPFASLKADLILGSDEFVEKLRQKLLVKKDPDVPQTRYFSTAVSFEEVLKIVSAHFGIAEREIEQADKRNNRARRACLYLLRKCTDLPSGQIAQRFQITYTAVTKACSRFEQEMKQDKELSFLVNECMRTLTGGPDSEI